MQQTSKYQFNLVDGSDDFSPAPLNQNAQKTETLFEGLEEDLAALETSLGQSMTDLEDSVDESLASVLAAVGSGGHNARIAFGSYTGTGKRGSGNPNTLTFDFVPVLVFVGTSGSTENGNFPGVFFRGMNRGHSCTNVLDLSYYISVSWTGTGLSWYSNLDQFHQMNASDTQYDYVAIGYDNGNAT